MSVIVVAWHQPQGAISVPLLVRERLYWHRVPFGVELQLDRCRFVARDFVAGNMQLLSIQENLFTYFPSPIGSAFRAFITCLNTVLPIRKSEQPVSLITCVFVEYM